MCRSTELIHWDCWEWKWKWHHCKSVNHLTLLADGRSIIMGPIIIEPVSRITDIQSPLGSPRVLVPVQVSTKPRDKVRRQKSMSLNNATSKRTKLEKKYYTGMLPTVFLLLGIGVLLPWNAYISAKPYFQARLSNCTTTATATATETGDTIEAWFSLLFNGGSVVSLAIMISFQFCFYDGRGQSTESSTSNWYLVMVPLGIYLLVFTGTTLLVLFPSVPSTIFWLWTLLGFTLCGVCTSIASAGIVGTAGRLEEHIGIHPYFNGQAVGGLLVAIGNLAAGYWDHHNDRDVNRDMLECQDYTEISWSTVGYFAASCLVLASCMIGYSIVDSLVLHSDCTGGCQSFPTELSPLLPTINNNDEESQGIYYYKYYAKKKSVTMTNACRNLDAFQCEDTDSTSSDTTSTASTTSLDDTRDEESDFSDDEELGNLTVRVLYSVAGPAFCLFLTYFVTLAIFPVWTSELSSIHTPTGNTLFERIQTDLYTPMTFCVFNAGDLVGRLLSSWRSQNRPGLITASLMRVAFFFLFLACPSHYSTPGTHTLWMIPTDIYSWVIQFSLAVSNGYLTNIAFSVAPALVESRDTQPQQIASAILNWSMSLGLLCGSVASFYYLQWAAATVVQGSAGTWFIILPVFNSLQKYLLILYLYHHITSHPILYHFASNIGTTNWE